MEHLTCREVLTATKGKLLRGNIEDQIRDIFTDSRNNTHSQGLFVPIVGETFNGHTFIHDAVIDGAAGALTTGAESQKALKDFPEDKILIEVEDTLTALGDLAKAIRNKFEGKLIGITGSVGKTSTKEMIANLLATQYRIHKTQGNFNNEIGLPLTIFAVKKEHNAMVLEMGMSGLGEIARLSEISRPDIAVITNIGTSHIANLGSRQNILKAKLEILQGMSEDGVVILNADDNMLSGAKGMIKQKTVTYGLDEEAGICAANAVIEGEEGIEFDVRMDGKEYPFHLPAPGMHNIYNALAAIAVGREMGISISNMQSGIKNYSSDGMRMGIVESNGVKYINDSYNASPISMTAALSVLKDIHVKGRRIAVLGEMMELGSWTQSSHYEVGMDAAKKMIDQLVVVGESSFYTKRGAAEGGMKEENIIQLSSNREAIEFLKSFIKEGDAVLFKGSRGAKMEEIFKALQ